MQSKVNFKHARKAIRSAPQKGFATFRCPRGHTPFLQASQCFLLQKALAAHHRRFSTSKLCKKPMRGKITTIHTKDLIKNTNPTDSDRQDEEPKTSYPTVARQARENMLKYKDCVVLTRIGNFYELYFEQAEEYGPLLGLKVASKKTNAGPVPMAGFPFFQLERFLKTLIQDHGKHVAIAEETANNPSTKIKSGGLLFDRQVTRVVTPGTLIDEHFIAPHEHNYLMAIFVGTSDGTASTARVSENTESSKALSVKVGLAWLDLSSGDFFTQSIDEPNQLASAIARIGPRETILGTSNQSIMNDSRFAFLSTEGANNITYVKSDPSALAPTQNLDHIFADQARAVQPGRFSAEEVTSTQVLLDYIQNQLPGLNLRVLQRPTRQQDTEYMKIDKGTLRGLEVTQTLRDGSFKGSLLHAVRRTSTESGARLLSRRLTSPSMSLDIINDRLGLVQDLLDNDVLREQLRTQLKRTSDSHRLVQRFSFGLGDADDLVALSRTIGLTQDIANLMTPSINRDSLSLKRLLDRFNFDGPSQLAESILEAIDQDGLSARQQNQEMDAAEAAGMARGVIAEDRSSEDMATLNKRLHSKRFTKAQNTAEDLSEDKVKPEDIWIMRRSASDTLERLHRSLDSLQREKSDLAASLRTKLGASSLTLRMTPGLGHICHVKGKDTKADFFALLQQDGQGAPRTVSSSKSTRSFYLPTWTRLGGRIDEARLRIRTEEQSLFQSLRQSVIANLTPLRRNATVLDELDVAASFASLAAEHNLVRPHLDSSTTYDVRQGRHLTVEAGLNAAGRTFTPNNCTLGDADSMSSARIWLITGPNMAGKSTFLRQTALLAILAQTGSFVPAASARLGLVDAVFSRIGSADNLASDQSTFMVEMIETAGILKGATERSLVVMDEVGRGTTAEDGLAVGYAVLKWLAGVGGRKGVRSLFATHFHALADLTTGEGKGLQGNDDGSVFGGRLGCYCTRVVEEEDSFGELGFRFDHRMRPGVNRDSHALKVAKLAGMPEGAVETARKVLNSLKENGRGLSGMSRAHSGGSDGTLEGNGRDTA